MLPAGIRKVVKVIGDSVQEEARGSVRAFARLLDVVQLAPVDVQIELRARRRLAGNDHSILESQPRTHDNMRCAPSIAVDSASIDFDNVVLRNVDAGQTLAVE